MDVGNFLEFERAFHRDRELCAATQEQRVILGDELLRERFDVVVERERIAPNRPALQVAR